MSAAAKLDKSAWNARQLLVERPAWPMPEFPQYEKTPKFNNRDNRTDWGPYVSFTDGHVFRRPIVRSKVKATVTVIKPKVKVDSKNKEMLLRLVNDKVPCIIDFTKTYGNDSNLTFNYQSGGIKNSIIKPRRRAVNKNIDEMSDRQLMPPPRPPCPGGRGRGRRGVFWLAKKVGWKEGNEKEADKKEGNNEKEGNEKEGNEKEGNKKEGNNKEGNNKEGNR